VHRARVFGRCEPATGIEPFGRLVTQVMTTEPYASARRVFWVVDNGSSHRGQAAARRLQGAWPTLHLVHLPIHASWLNQVEVYFSVIQRKILTPSDFGSLAEAKPRCWPSRTITSRSPPHSSGSSPNPTSTSCSNASPPTNQPRR
jgi:hypothetical protein